MAFAGGHAEIGTRAVSVLEGFFDLQVALPSGGCASAVDPRLQQPSLSRGSLLQSAEGREPSRDDPSFHADADGRLAAR
jgi:hypothetical protein